MGSSPLQNIRRRIPQQTTHPAGSDRTEPKPRRSQSRRQGSLPAG